MNKALTLSKPARPTFLSRAKRDLKKNWPLYTMIIPVVLFYAIFCYKPMYGAVIAFQDYTPGKGILGSQWVGLKHFISFVTEPDFLKLMRNTVMLSVSNLVLGFPAPIIFALMLNELWGNRFKKVTQSLTYLPHFISLVVICGMIKDFVSKTGLISVLLSSLTGGEPFDMLSRSELFIPIYVISDIWQGLGWNSIIYVAALAGVDRSLYEAAKIDGAGKLKQLLHVTLPGIAPTIIIMLILRVGSLLNLGFEKNLLLYNPLIYDRSDIISTYVYRLGFEGQQWSYTTAIGLFNSVINFALLIAANKISARTSETSLW